MKLLEKTLSKVYVALKSSFDIQYINNQKRNCVCDATTIIRPIAKIRNLSKNANTIIIGSNTVIDGELLTFNYGGKINIGTYCYIGENTKIWSGESIEIGNQVLISHNVNITDTNSHEIDHIERANGYEKLLKSGHSATKGTIISLPIVIEDNVWISFNVVILKGVRIGKGAIIAAGAVVTKDVPEFKMVAGNPAIVIKDLK